MLISLLLFALVAPAAAKARSAEALCSEGQGMCVGNPMVRDNLLLQMEHVASVTKSEEAVDEERTIDDVPPLKPEWAAGLMPNESSGGIGLIEQEEQFLRSGQPTAKEWEHFQLVKAARRQGYTCPDGTRYPPNNGEFEWDCRLMRAARGWSQRQATENFAGHTHQGSTSCQRTEAQGYPKNRGCGENLALGKPGAAEAIQQLKESNGHCKNMYEPAFNMLGVGYFESSQATYRYYWTDAFGAWHQGPDQSCIGGSPAPSPAPGCADIDTSNCQYYKSQNLCSKSPNVQAQCKDTCGIGGCGSGGSPSPSPQPSSSPQPPSDCRDTTGSCDYYKSKGYCSSSANVKAGCKKTCGLCGSPSCQDTAGSCDHYRGLGYCSNNANVKAGCKKTCGLC